MTIQKKQHLTSLAIMLVIVSSLSGCLSTQKMNTFVAGQYNNVLPKQDKKRNTDITVSSSIPVSSGEIATSYKKTSNMLPLLFYWQWDYRHTCSLNPAIAVNNFANAVYVQANKGLNQKLNGKKLELTVEQAPQVFSLVDKAHLIWLIIYKVSWDKLFVEPDLKDLIVSYKVLENGAEVKSGKISIKNNEQNKNLRFFQSWKSATSEYLARYNQDVTNMSRAFVNDLIGEL